MRLRDSLEWNALQRELMGEGEQGREANMTPVTYAAGGTYGMSHSGATHSLH